jgi:hypothetical protein
MRRGSFVAILAVAVLVLFHPAAGRASNIVVSFTPDGSDCTGTVPINTMVTWYIVAILGGDAAANGITGAEFRQVSTPGGWFMNAVPNPASSISIGDPLGPCGANLAFPSCQPGANGAVLLYTVSGFATTQVTNAWLAIERHACTAQPPWLCPLLVICDAPVYTMVCVPPGGFAIINGDHCVCCPAVDPASWSRVKALYTQD